ncbi:primary-amine oxidase [Sulfolobus acidocaldarius]|uniref:Amine oxidase n=4 Tax=Sulfolobus acidocaldarius TaxID=2285 RepID=Q4J6W4_SULAC|nr:primary-amine oxidase [Sulfolobus acidocaldarius]AAY81468.1 copper amine oxidase [Sulfolobus acidocaldarius DSM 639]AGE72071.1 tyramine oxidase [Sulfolobus acidocaldarius N8]AGE74389.1 tyramine oxidase [Sulfolobus acidocaldarius Ron12/I]ALU32480.1 tyramine oxidase [Sulfolobus acidocaldarius]WCM33845.1 primary-amine oxidase [Sulfolobus acidocaldarius DSM 639]
MVEESKVNSRLVKSPLDPLDENEIEIAAQVIREKIVLEKGESIKFIAIMLNEPEKDDYLKWKRGEKSVERQALVKFYNPAEEGKVYEAIVSIESRSIVSVHEIKNVHAPITLDEFGECEKAVRNDKRVQEALQKRGILPNDLNLLIVDCWSPGYVNEAERNKRLAIGYMWIKKDLKDNNYARPVHGLMPWVDLNKMEVVRIDDFGEAPLPELSSDYTPERRKDIQVDSLKPIEILQPQGSSVEVNGYEIKWYRWRLRIGYTPREGLVIYDVRYNYKGRERQIIYRASVVDLMVPYGDPSPFHYRKMVLDAGDYGLGNFIVPLKHGNGELYDCDCLGEGIYHFDVVRASSDGKPVKVKKAICVHEEDFNVIWRHTDLRSGDSEVRRNRRLVVSFWATLANYDYGFFWHFYQDGSIELMVKLTGIINDDAAPKGQKRKYGTLVTPEVYGPIHIHWFNIRLDLDIDGQINRVYEVNLKPESIGPENPLGNAFYAEETLLKNELEARRHVNPQSGRYWKIVNLKKSNYLGEPVAYRFIPRENVACPLPDESFVRKRGGYINYHLWVTPYDPNERYATGDYPYERIGEGLPKYVEKNRSIVDKDIVLWYTLGVEHVVRVEDWPVMPVEMAGFMLRPDGFFDENPCIDLPRELPSNNENKYRMKHTHGSH